jgi:hypothetical protein
VPLSHTDVTSVGTLAELKTKSWHGSKPLQRCNTKTTGLCKTLHPMLEPIWSLLMTPELRGPSF